MDTHEILSVGRTLVSDGGHALPYSAHVQRQECPQEDLGGSITKSASFTNLYIRCKLTGTIKTVGFFTNCPEKLKNIEIL